MDSAVTRVRDGDLYRALMRKDTRKVIELCRIVTDGALHVVTIHNDTVLHMAAYSRQERLLELLLTDLPRLEDQHHNKITHQNDNGNTILHEAAVTIQNSSVADIMLRIAPELLGMRNHLGETSIFPAVLYGNTKMFEFLADKEKVSNDSEQDRQAFLQRYDKTTVFHISILAENFELALVIAKKYDFLISKPDKDGMTGLQLLSSNSSVFRSRSEHAFLNQVVNPVKSWRHKHMYKYALRLAKFLIERDTSWVATKPGINLSKPMPHNYGVNPKASSLEKDSGEGSSTSSLCQGKGKGCSSNTNEDSFRGERLFSGSLSQGERGGEGLQTSNETMSNVKINGETPLFLATRSGCVKIVKNILNQYPQAVEYVNDQGQNILHLAIQYRQLKIFKLVKEMNVPMQRLVQHVDINGNSILHMVGARRDQDNEVEDMQDPAFKLKEELLWFERVKKVTITHLISHRNSVKQTADGLFASTNRELHNKAKQWIKRTAEGFSVAAVLIASVTFAAAYTIPGGPNQNTGFPLLLSRPFFLVFIISNVASFASSLMMMVAYVLILKSSLHIEDFKKSLPQKLEAGFVIFCFSVTFMMIAFAATIVLMIQHRKSWTKVTEYGAAVGCFTILFFLLYFIVSKPGDKYLRKKTKLENPRSHSVQILTKINNLFKYHNTDPS